MLEEQSSPDEQTCKYKLPSKIDMPPESNHQENRTEDETSDVSQEIEPRDQPPANK